MNFLANGYSQFDNFRKTLVTRIKQSPVAEAFGDINAASSCSIYTHPYKCIAFQFIIGYDSSQSLVIRNKSLPIITSESSSPITEKCSRNARVCMHQLYPFLTPRRVIVLENLSARVNSVSSRSKMEELDIILTPHRESGAITTEQYIAHIGNVSDQFLKHTKCKFCLMQLILQRNNLDNESPLYQGLQTAIIRHKSVLVLFSVFANVDDDVDGIDSSKLLLTGVSELFMVAECDSTNCVLSIVSASRGDIPVLLKVSLIRAATLVTEESGKAARLKVLHLRSAGLSWKNIQSEVVNQDRRFIHRGTFQKIVSKYKEIGSVEDRKRPGQPSKLTYREKRFLRI
ncbi:hypothetical protein KUTeg_012597 [Tegillarca granosa]|uniref:Uncharacterized protein n=1 Tax=Tegillarca granosa TaxID=220873 RepID=A0ABQ9F016_TEGGR|nr:hypothetical protein KUTeg_012597 [Tegillarca granosa]